MSNERRQSIRAECDSAGGIGAYERALSCTISDISNGGPQISSCERIEVGRSSYCLMRSRHIFAECCGGVTMSSALNFSIRESFPPVIRGMAVPPIETGTPSCRVRSMRKGAGAILCTNMFGHAQHPTQQIVAKASTRCRDSALPQCTKQAGGH